MYVFLTKLPTCIYLRNMFVRRSYWLFVLDICLVLANNINKIHIAVAFYISCYVQLSNSLRDMFVRCSYYSASNVSHVLTADKNWLKNISKCFFFLTKLLSCVKQVQSNLRLRPLLVSDHLSSATRFPKYQRFASQITIFGASCKRPRPLL